MGNNISTEIKTMKIAGLIKESIVDGPGIRLVIFCQGCPHACKGCHNPETHDFNGGKTVKLEAILGMLDENPLLTGVTFSGGEPFCSSRAVRYLCEKIKEKGLDIVIYSGYTYEELVKLSRLNEDIGYIMRSADYLVDGPYVEELSDKTLIFRGSSNQNFIDLKETREKGIKKCLY